MTGLGVAALVVSAIVAAWSRPVLWLDEAQSVAIARLPWTELVDGLRADGAPPLYYVLLRVWMAVFGSGDLAVRSLSVALGFAALGVLAVAARRLFGALAAWPTALIAASSPFFARYASETRMYSLVMLEVALGVVAVEAAMRARTTRRLCAVAAVSGALVLTHYWGMFVVAACVWVATVIASCRADARARCAAVIGAVVVGVLATAWWWPVLAFQAEHTGTPWTQPSSVGDAVLVSVQRGRGQGWLSVLVSVSGAGLLALGTVLAVAGRRPGGAVIDATRLARLRWMVAAGMTTWVVAYVATRATSSAFVPRYTMVLFPLQVLVIAGALVLAVAPRVVLAVTAALWVAGTWTSIAEIDSARTRAPAFAEVLLAESTPGDLIVYCPDQLGPPLSRLLDRATDDLPRQWVFPTKAAPDRVDWIDYRQRHEQSSPAGFADDAVAAAGTNRIWVVVSATYPPTQQACFGLVAELGERSESSAVRVPEAPGWRDHDQLLMFTPAPVPPPR